MASGVLNLYVDRISAARTALYLKLGVLFSNSDMYPKGQYIRQ